MKLQFYVPQIFILLIVFILFSFFSQAMSQNTIKLELIFTSDWHNFIFRSPGGTGEYGLRTSSLKFASKATLSQFYVYPDGIIVRKAEQYNSDSVIVSIIVDYTTNTSFIMGSAKGGLGSTNIRVYDSSEQLLYEFNDNSADGGAFSYEVYNFNAPVSTNNNNLQSNERNFRLEQNYPNPFNPWTTIEFEMPMEENVTIKIYDINGRLIKTLLDEKKPLGIHSVIWDGKNNSGNNVATGTYFYQIQMGNLLESKKMILLK